MQRFHEERPHPSLLPVLPHSQTLAARISLSDIFAIVVQMSDFMLFHLLRVPTSKYKHLQLWWPPRHTQTLHAAYIHYTSLRLLNCVVIITCCYVFLPSSTLSHWTRIPCFIYLLSQVLCIKLWINKCICWMNDLLILMNTVNDSGPFDTNTVVFMFL